MGSDDIFKKKKGKKKKRKIESIELAPYRYLLVCEGEKTEPLYFESFKKLVNKKYKDTIKVNRYTIDILGTGRNTEDLVKYTEEAIQRELNQGSLPYGNVWVIFDKDDFSKAQFNNAIYKSKNNGYNVAWSNECIELWFILHFEYLNTAITRTQYIEKLNEYFEVLGLGKYQKNMTNIYEIITSNGNVNAAIANAKKLEKANEDREPADKMPCTTVYKLVKELNDILKQ